MPKFFRSIFGRKMVSLLEDVGFFTVSQKGSHIKLKRIHDGDAEIVIIPDHKELTPGTFRSVLNMAKISLEQFDLLRKEK